MAGQDVSLDWPALPWDEWRETQATLHMWLQIAGKLKLALTPFLNEWWNVTFSVSARGLASGPMPYQQGVLDAEFDFVEHNLHLRTSQGEHKALPLMPRSVARFYAEVMLALDALGVEVTINPVPAEVPNPIRCDENEVNASYDFDYVQRFWRILVGVERVLQRFRTPFVGKSSAPQFWWGSFDFSLSRFSGRAAPLAPAEWPRWARLGADQEDFSCGFWPGNATAMGPELGQAAFFAYVYPKPEGFEQAAVRPGGAFFHTGLGEFILPYEEVRSSASPEQLILEFFQSAYEAGANLAGWDRSALERQP